MSNKHTCQAIVITCIDFRFQEFIDRWIDEKYGKRNFDRVAFAGGVFDLETVLKQVKISSRLHEIKEVVLINHEECGAYGEEGTHERHVADLKNAMQRIKDECGNLNTLAYYLHLDGTFEQVS